MHYKEGDPEKLKSKFWRAFADSPFTFLQLDADPASAVPMTAQLDKDADSAIWFFTSRDHTFAKAGAATATFSGKGHDLFARFTGTLIEETSRERLDKEWSNFVDAWYPGGKDDPGLLMLRMDLGGVEIWDSDLGMMTTARMALGMNVREEGREGHVQTTL